MHKSLWYKGSAILTFAAIANTHPRGRRNMSNNSSTRGFFRNAFDAMIAARERQAKHYVAQMTRMYGDSISRLNDQRKSD